MAYTKYAARRMATRANVIEIIAEPAMGRRTTAMFGGSQSAVAPQTTTDHAGGPMVAKRFKRGDHVSWNSEAGRAHGRITRVVTSPTKFKGYTVRASRDEPQYEIKSETTDHIAMHKGSALTKRRQ
jgi:hypothetical protein